MYVGAMLDRDEPFRRVVGWRDALPKADPGTFKAYRARYPAIAGLPPFGGRVIVLAGGRLAGVGGPREVVTPALLAAVYGVRARVEPIGEEIPRDRGRVAAGR